MAFVDLLTLNLKWMTNSLDSFRRNPTPTSHNNGHFEFSMNTQLYSTADPQQWKPSQEEVSQQECLRDGDHVPRRINAREGEEGKPEGKLVTLNLIPRLMNSEPARKVSSALRASFYP